jgi:hypothetical protein
MTQNFSTPSEPISQPLSDRPRQDPRMKNENVRMQRKEIIVARFGAAALVRTPEGRFTLRGGNKSDHIEARDWASMFLHEAVIRSN